VRKVRAPERTISSLKESAQVFTHLGKADENGAAPHELGERRR
jgi:hypothetical protein